MTGSKSHNHNAFPNPFINSFQVSGGETIAKIKILDENGEIIQESSELSYSINLSHAPSGLYLVIIFNSNQEIIDTIRIIKQ